MEFFAKYTVTNNIFLKMKYVFFFLLILVRFNCSYSQVRMLNGSEIENTVIDRFLNKEMDSLNVKGLSIAIINDGKVTYHRTLGVTNVYTRDMVNNQTLFEAASLAKPLFAYFVMRLVEKKVLALDTPLYQYLPYRDIEHDVRYKLITARMVLNHTTGFPNWKGNDSLKILFTPGAKFSYSGEGYLYLAKVIAKQTHCSLKNLDSLFQKEVAVSLGLKHTHFIINQYIAKNLATAHKGENIVYDNSWDRTIFDPAGGLYTDAIDYAIFLVAVMEGKGLGKESIDEMLKEQVQLSNDDKRRTQFGITGWGLGFSRKPSQYGINYLHGGNNSGYTSSFMFNKEKKIGFVFFTNTDQCNTLKQTMEKFLTYGK